MKIGIIGIGTIGQLLASRFIESGKTKPSEIIVSDIDKRKLKLIKDKSLVISSDNKTVVENSNLVFLCVKPQNLREVIRDLSECELEDKLFVSTVAAVSSSFYMRKLKNIKLIRIIPSITNQFESGVVLYNTNNSTNTTDEKILLEKIALLGKSYKVTEGRLDELTHLSSCGPAFIGYFLQQFLSSVKSQEESEAEKEILIETLKGTTRLLEEKGFDFIRETCTEGGITQEGINEMSNIAPILDRMAFKIKEKHLLIRTEVEQNENN